MLNSWTLSVSKDTIGMAYRPFADRIMEAVYVYKGGVQAHSSLMLQTLFTSRP